MPAHDFVIIPSNRDTVSGRRGAGWLPGDGFMGRRSIVLISIIFAAFIAGAGRADEVYYLSRSSGWRYFRGLSEASAPDAAGWRDPSFHDETWDSGVAPFGYGDPPYGTD